MVSALGFSQSLPFTFDESADPTYYFKGVYDCNFRLTTDPDDPSNPVGEIESYSYAEYGSAQTLVLEQNIDLSENSTITFRIKPRNGTGSGMHRLRFTGGTPFIEKDFQTTGTDWQDVSIDLGPNLGSYRNLILFLDFGYQNFSTDVYFIDDIAGGTNVALPPTPSQSAPRPTISASKVKGVYGETYNNLKYLYNFTDSFRAVDIENDGNETLEIDLGYYGAAFENTDVSEDLYVHFDYWTTDATQFQFRINSENPPSFERKYVVGIDEPIVNNAWTSVFIPLTHYGVGGAQPVNLRDVFQFNFVDNGAGGTIFIDNIYFTSEENILGVKDIALSNFVVSPNPSAGNWTIKSKNQVIASIQVYDVLGKAVMSLSPNSTSTSIDSSNLKAGLYFAQVKTQTGVASLKLVKK